MEWTINVISFKITRLKENNMEYAINIKNKKLTIS
jgi:hypothetical protein